MKNAYGRTKKSSFSKALMRGVFGGFPLLVAGLLPIAAYAQCASNGGTISVPTTGGACTISVAGSTLTVDSSYNGWLNFTGSNTSLIVNSGGSLVYSGSGSSQPSGFSTSGSNNNWSLTNAGSISMAGSSADDMIGLRSAGTFTVNNTGLIQNSSTNGSSSTFEINGGNYSLTLTNSGTISSNAGTVFNLVSTGTVVINNLAGGTLSSNTRLIDDAGGTLTINNQGTMSTSQAGNWLINSYATVTLRNSGSILNTAAGSQGTMWLSGGNDVVILEPTSVINGWVEAAGGTNTLALGGNTGSGSFSLASIGGSLQYRDFQVFDKRETSTWTLTGTNSSQNTNWTLNGGTLILASGAVLNSPAGSQAILNPSSSTANVALQVSGTINVGSGTAIEMDGSGNNSVVLNSGAAFGAGTFRVGGGFVTLTGAAAFPNTVTISGGTLQVGDGGVGTGGAISGNIVDNAALIFNHGDNISYTGIISGAGTVTQAGAGTLTLSGNNTYSGGTFLNNGVLSVSSNANLGNTTGALTFNGGTLLTTAGITSARAVNLVSVGIIDNGGNSDTFSGTVSGAGALVLNGSGTMVLSGTNTYAGGTSVNGGTLSIGSDANLGNAAGGLTLNSAVLVTTGAVTSSRAVTLSGTGGTFNTGVFNDSLNGTVSGGGMLTKTGTGTLTLSGTNAYSGGTTITGGTLVATNGLALGSGSVANNAALQLAFATNGTLANVLSGSGSLTKTGAGVATLTAAGSTQGAVAVNAGTLAFGQAGVFNAASLSTASGAATSLSSNSTLNLSGALTQNSGATLNVAIGNNAPAITAATAALSGALSVTGLSATAPASASALINTQYTVIHTAAANGITGDFTSVNLNGATSAVDYLIYNGSKSANNQDYNVGLGLTWYAGPTLGNGVFTLTNSTDTFNVDVVLSNQAASTTGWDGTTLTKNGAGTLTLSSVNTYTGNTVINGGTLQAGAANAFATSANVSVASGATLDLNSLNQTANNLSGAGNVTLGLAALTVNSTANTTLSGVMSGTGSLAKTGAGTFTLSGVNTYSGGTTVTGGTLVATNGSALGTGSIANSAALQLAFATNGTLANVLSGNGSLTKTGTGIATLTGAGSTQGAVTVNAGTLAFGQNGVFNATSLSTASGATTSLSGNSTLNLSGVLTQNSGATLNVTIGNNAPAITAATAALNGALSVTGFTTAAPASASALTNTQYTVIHTAAANGITGDFTSVNLNGAASTVDYLTIAGAKSANNQDYNVGFGLTWFAGPTLGNGAFTLANASDTFNVDVVLSNQASSATGWDGTTLTKNGAGTLTLSSVNTYTGNTVINGGTLQAGTANAFATSANVSVASGATLDLNSFNQTANNLSGGGNVTLGSAALTASNNTDTTFSGVMSGTGSLTKTGANALTLSGVNTYSGGTTISAGTLIATNSSALGSGSIANSAALQLAFATNGTLANVLSGNGSLTKTGAGVATLTAAGSTQGAVTVNAGTLAFGQTGVFNATSLSTANGASTSLSGNSTLNLSGALTQNSGATLNVAIGNNAPAITATTAALNGALSVTGFTTAAPASASALTNTQYTVVHTAAANGITGDFTSVNLNGAASTVDYLTIAGAKSANNQDYNVGFGLTWFAGPTLGNGAFTLANAADTFNVDVVLSNQASSATGWDGTTLTKNGAGTLILSSVNTYTGNTVINGGTLQAGTANAFASSANVSVATGATLDLNSLNQTANNLSGGGDVTLGSAALTVNSTANTALSGVISGTGTLAKTGAGTFTLSGVNTYSGGTTITGGTLVATNGSALGTGNVTDNAALELAFATDSTLANVISGSGSLTKTGAGAATVSGTNTYSGGTTITAGTLIATNGSALGTGSVANNAALQLAFASDNTFANILSGNGSLTKTGAGIATLTGAGSTQGAVTVNAGTLAFGQNGVFNAASLSTASGASTSLSANSTLNLSGVLTQNSGATLNVTIGGANSPAITAATAALNGALSVTGFTTAAPASASALTNTQYTVVHTAAANGITGDFTSVNLNGAASTVDYLTIAGAKSANNQDYNVGFGLTWFAGPTLGNGAFTLANAADTFNVDVVLSNQSSSATGWDGTTLTKNGAGTLTLSSVNTYTGNTVINGGTLQAGTANAFATSANVSVATGATLDLNSFNQTANNLSGGGNVTLGSGTLTANSSIATTFSGAITGTGGLVKTGTNTLTLSGAGSTVGAVAVNAGTLAFGQAGVFNAASLSTANGASTSLSANSTLNLSGALTQNSGATLSVAIGNNAPAITAATAALNGALNVTGFMTAAPASASALSGTQYTVVHTAAANGITGDFTSVNLNGAASTVDYLTIAGAKSANNQDYNVGFGLTWFAGPTLGNGAFTLANSTDTFNVDVVLSNQASSATGWDGTTLTKNGAGTLTLSSVNTYTGNTTVNGGTLQAGTANAFATSANVSVATGATLDLNSFNQTANNLSGGGNVTLGSGTLTANSSIATTFSGAITGTGGLVKTGTNTLTLSGAGSTVGAVAVNAGTLAFGQTGVFNAASLSTASGATTSLSGNSTLNLSGVLTQNGGATLNVMIGNNSPAITAATAALNGALSVSGFTTAAPASASALTNTQYTVVHTAAANGITGDFTSVNLNGATSAVDYLTIAGAKSANNQDYNVGYGLTWFAGPTLGNGAFTLANAADTFNVDVVLSNQASSATGWDGTTLTKNGAGTLILSSVNTYTGNTVINSGTLQAGTANAFASSANVSVATGATLDLNSLNQTANNLSGGGDVTLGSAALTVNSTANTALSGVISGTGTLAKTGAGTFTLSGVNTYSGGTTITGGTLVATNGSALGTGNVTDNAALELAFATDSTLANVISGSGSLTKTGAGAATVSGTNTYSGGTTISAGTLIATNGSALGTGSVANGAALQLAFASDNTFANVLSGSGSLTKTGAGIATLTGAGSTQGAVTVNAGTLAFGQDGAFNATSLSTASGASTSLSANSTLNLSGVLTQNSGATLNVAIGNNAPAITAATAALNGALNVTGFTTAAPASASALANTQYTVVHTAAANGITGDFTSVNLNGAASTVDYLTIAGAKSANNQDYNVGFGLTWFAGPTLGNGAFTLANAADTFNVDVVLSNQASSATGWDGTTLTKNGAGTLTLSSVNTYTGNTVINGGTLQAGTANAFATSANVSVATGATLDLNSLNQTANNLSGGGNVTLGSAALTANNNTDTTFSGVMSGTGSLTKIGANALTLSGVNTYSGGTTITGGTLVATNGSALGSGSVANGAALQLAFASDSTLANVLSGNGSLTKTGAGVATLTGAGSTQGAVSVNAGTLAFGQTGAFNATSLSTASGATTTFAAGSTLSLSGALTQNSGATLNVAVSTVQPVITAATASLDGTLNITGYTTGAPTKASDLPGTLFQVIHTTGGITGDFASVNLNGAASTVDYLTIAGAKSADNMDYNVGFGLTWFAGPTLGNGAFTLTNAADTFNVDVVLSNQASSTTGWDGTSLTKNGAGTLTLSSVNTYTGNTTVNGGTLQAGTANAFASSANVSVATGATLDLNSFNQTANNLSGGGNVTLGSAALTASNNTDTTFSGVMSGTGSLTKIGANALTLSGVNTYSGGTTITGGTLVATNGSALGTGSVANNAALQLAFASDSTLANVLSGNGSLTKTGAGVATLTGAGSTQGAVSVNAGTLAFGQTGAFNATSLSTASGATTTFAAGSTLSLSGALTQNSGATLNVAVSTVQPVITAATAALDGTLNITGYTTGAPTKASDLPGTLFQVIHTTGGITGDFASVNLNGAASSVDYLTIAGAKSADNMDYNVGFGLTWFAGPTLGNGVFTLTNSTDTFNVDVVLSNQASSATGWDGTSLTKNGAGTLTLSSVNTYTGNTTVNGGTLQAGTANAFATSANVLVATGATLDLNSFNQTANNLSGGGNVTLGSAALTVNSNTDTTFSGVVSGTGSLTKTGANALTLSGVNTYSGGTTISAGTLIATNGSALGTGSVANNAALQLAFASDNTFANVLSGNGSLTKTGTGVATLTGVGSTQGAVTVNAGTLAFGQNGVFNAASLSTASGASTSLSANSTLNLSGALTQNSGATLSVAIGNNAPAITAATAALSGALSVTGFTTAAPASASALTNTQYTVIHTAAANGIAGDFTSVNLNGAASTVDYLTIAGAKSANNQDYNVGFGLTWFAGPTLGNGVFTLTNSTDTFNVDVVLSNQASSATGWDGTTLTKNGAGTLTLSSVNTYTGNTTVNGGTLQAGTANAFASSANVSVATGATLDLNSFNQTANNLSGAGNVTLGSAALTVNSTADTAFSGVMSGTGTLAKTGAGTFTLSGGNTYSGGTTVTGGTLVATNGSALGTGSVANGAALQLAFAADGTLANVLSGNGSLTKTGAGVATLTAAGSTQGAVTVNAGTLAFGQTGVFNAASLSTASGATTSLSANSTLNLSGALTQNNGATLNVAVGSNSPVITASTAALSGTLNLTGVSATAPTSASALPATQFAVIHTTGGITGDFTSVSLGGATSTVNYLTLSSGKSANNMDYDVGLGLTWYAGPTLGNGLFTLTNSTDTFNVDVVLSNQAASATGWDGTTLTKDGAGTLTLSSVNTYTGDTIVSAGTLQTGTANAFATSANVSVASGATLDLNSFNQTANNLSGGGNVTLGSAALTVNSNTDTAFSGVVSDTGSLAKTGTGTFTLSGVNTYSGGTTITGGTLVATNGNALGTGTVANNAVLNLNYGAAANFTNALSGTGTTIVNGAPITITGANNAFAGAWQINTQATIDASTTSSNTNLGTASVAIANGATLTANTTGSFTFNNALTGSGTLNASNNGNAFAFGTAAGNAFTGTVNLQSDTFQLSGSSTTALTNATLNLNADNVTTVGMGNQAIGNLAINGATVQFHVIVPAPYTSDTTITTNNLNVANTGTIQIDIPPSFINPPPAPDLSVSLLEQDDVGVLVKLINANGTVTGFAGNLTVIDQNGQVVSNGQDIAISQGGNTVAMGTYDFRTTVGPATDGLYVNYGLTQLDLMGTGANALILQPNSANTSASAHDMSAKITGTGDLAIVANTNDYVSLSNRSNDYTGMTTVRSGTLVMNDNNVLGKTSNLAVESGAAFTTNGYSQTVGALNTQAGASVTITSGSSLTIADTQRNPGTPAGGALDANTLFGAGAFTVDPSTMRVNGDQGGFTGIVNMTGGSQLTLNSASAFNSSAGITLATAADTVTFGNLSSFNSAWTGIPHGIFSADLSGMGTVQLRDGADVQLVGHDTGFAGLFDVAAGSTLRVDASFELGSARIANNGTFVLTADSDWMIDNADAVTGSGTVQKRGFAQLAADQAFAGFTGLTDVQQGTLVLNTAAARLGGSANVASGAMLAGSGTIAGNVTNSGTIASLNALPSYAGIGVSNLTIGGTLTNSGLVQIGGSLVGNTLTVGSLIGQSGSSFVLNTVLGSDNSASDRLIINGGTATGQSLITIVNQGGLGAQTTGSGIMVVQAQNGATTTSGSFLLGSRVAAGAYDYSLYRGDTSGSGDSWYLRSTGPGPEPKPDIRPEVPLAGAAMPLAADFGYAMLGTLQDRVGDAFPAKAQPLYEDRTVSCNNPKTGYRCLARASLAATDQQKWFSGAWARVFAGRGMQQQGNFSLHGSDYDYTMVGVQAGLDLFAREQADGTLDKAGLAIGQGSVSANVKGVYGGKAGTVDMNATSLSAYWTHYDASGWYTDAVVQSSWYSMKGTSVEGQQIKPNGFGIIGSLEGGYQFKLGSGWTLEPQAQVMYQHLTFGTAYDAYGVFKFDDTDSLRARLGARVTKTWNMGDDKEPRLVKAWLRANVWHEFLGKSTVTATDLNGGNPYSTTSSLGGTWGEIGAGVTAQISDKVNLFATGAYQHSLDNKGRQSWDGKLGMTINW